LGAGGGLTPGSHLQVYARMATKPAPFGSCQVCGAPLEAPYASYISVGTRGLVCPDGHPQPGRRVVTEFVPRRSLVDRLLRR